MAKKLASAVDLGRRRMKQLDKEGRKKLARAGGLVGGKARAAALTAAQRAEIARKAAAKRWAGHEPKRPASKGAKK